MNSPLNALTPHVHRLEGLLKGLLISGPSPRLADALQYAVLNGGKRLRPMLVWGSCEAFGGNPQQGDITACSVELIHCYSLVHDDLPAMDDDSLRRGKPTCHIEFDEATAILVGDALQTLAFEILADDPDLTVNDRTRLEMISVLSRAAGREGMVAGQSLDMQAVNRELALPELEQLHLLKTGALIRASILLGAMCGKAGGSELEEHEFTLLTNFADCVGLAFQVRDDILDVIADTSTMGKQQGRDVDLKKSTSVSLMGLEGAEKHCRQLVDEGLTSLSALSPETDTLEKLALYIATREH